MNLQGKSAIITGAGSGVGKAIALELARQGASVLVCDVNEAAGKRVAAEIEDMGRRGVAFKADVAIEEEVKDMFGVAVDSFEKVDVVVCNAGNSAPAMLHKMTLEKWNAVIDVHLKGTFLCMREAARHMIERKEGKIICTVSVAGIQGSIGQPNYAAAKGGIIALVKSAAKELSRYNILVNAVSLGVVETAMTFKILSDEKLKQATLSRTLLRKVFKPEEVAPVFSFLASDAANSIQGQVIAADGGIVGLG